MQPTAFFMGIQQADCLQIGIDDGAPDKFHAAGLQRFVSHIPQAPAHADGVVVAKIAADLTHDHRHGIGMVKCTEALLLPFRLCYNQAKEYGICR